MNIGVDTVRKKIEDEFAPDKEELYRRTLEAAHIDEGRYFAGMIHDDLDAMLADIREAHKRDRLSAPEELPAVEFAKDLEEILREGPNKEKQIKAAAKQFGLKRNDLSDEDWAVLIRVVDTIKLKNGGKKRGKKG